ncbi:MAG: NAD(P)H-dependent oxidoreductase [Candidatus Hydrogenedentes bacterium]|nr:NAD(P)H-dependent oxidoreductase [Candidatus Hydrogenedentota bacterium]
MAYLVLSCSLNPQSRSRVLARAAALRIEERGGDVDFLDLRDFPMPLCDGGMTALDANAQSVARRIAESDGIFLACPVYNFNVSSSVKNVIELTGTAWQNKVVAIVCATGGDASFMAHMGIANSLMLDFRSVIVPRFVHASELEVTPERIVGADTQRRLDETVTLFLRIARALNPLPENAGPSA